MTNWGATPEQLKRWDDEAKRSLCRTLKMALHYGTTDSTKRKQNMTEVKISICGVEMTPDQAKKVYQELGKLFSPTPPSIIGPSRNIQNPTDRFPPISTWPSAPPMFGPKLDPNLWPH